MPRMNTIMRKNLNLKGTKEPIIHKGYYQQYFKEKSYIEKISSLAEQLIDVGKNNGEAYFAKTDVKMVRDGSFYNLSSLGSNG